MSLSPHFEREKNTQHSLTQKAEYALPGDGGVRRVAAHSDGRRDLLKTRGRIGLSLEFQDARKKKKKKKKKQKKPYISKADCLVSKHSLFKDGGFSPSRPHTLSTCAAPRRDRARRAAVFAAPPQNARGLGFFLEKRYEEFRLCLPKKAHTLCAPSKAKRELSQSSCFTLKIHGKIREDESVFAIVTRVLVFFREKNHPRNWNVARRLGPSSAAQKARAVPCLVPPSREARLAR